VSVMLLAQVCDCVPTDATSCHAPSQFVEYPRPSKPVNLRTTLILRDVADVRVCSISVPSQTSTIVALWHVNVQKTCHS
jgi:hypothetical protein